MENGVCVVAAARTREGGGNAESERNEQRRVREAESERRCASEGDRKQATASEGVNGGMDGWRTAFAL